MPSSGLPALHNIDMFNCLSNNIHLSNEKDGKLGIAGQKACSGIFLEHVSAELPN